MFQGFAMNAWLSLKINQWWVIILLHTHIQIHRKITLVPSKQHECKKNVWVFRFKWSWSHLRLLAESEFPSYFLLSHRLRKAPWVGCHWHLWAASSSAFFSPFLFYFLYLPPFPHPSSLPPSLPLPLPYFLCSFLKFNCAVLSCFSRVWLFATLWTIAHQAPPSMGFSSQEHWSGLSCPSPGDLPDPGIEPMSPALAGRFFTTRWFFTTREDPLFTFSKRWDCLK